MGSEGGQTPHRSPGALPAHRGCCPRTLRPCSMAAWHHRHAVTPQPEALSIPRASVGIAAPQHRLPCPMAQGEPAHSPAALVLRMPQSPAEQNTCSRSGVWELWLRNRDLRQGPAVCPREADTEQPCQRAQGNAQGEATLPRGRGDVQGDRGPSRLQTLRSSRD